MFLREEGDDSRCFPYLLLIHCSQRYDFIRFTPQVFTLILDWPGIACEIRVKAVRRACRPSVALSVRPLYGYLPILGQISFYTSGTSFSSLSVIGRVFFNKDQSSRLYFIYLYRTIECYGYFAYTTS